MTTLTLDRVLADAETLPADEREMLEELLRNRRIEAWRAETAAEAKKAAISFRAGRLKAMSVETVIARLRRAK
jgi:hypothetical protein